MGTSNNAINYTYDLLGNIASYTNGAGVTITQAPFSGAGQLTSVTSSLSGANHPSRLLSGVHYNALGEVSSATLGNLATESFGYAQRGWPQSATVTSNTVVTASAPGKGSVTINGSEQSHTDYGYSSSQGPAGPNGAADDGGGGSSWYIPGTYNTYASAYIWVDGGVTDYLDVTISDSASPATPQ